MTASYLRLTRDVAACIAFVSVAYTVLWASGMQVGHNRLWSDAEAYEIPKYQLSADHVFEHGPLLWNPWEFGGIPMLATSQSGSVNPMVWLCYGMLDFDAAHQLYIALLLVVGAVSAFLLARALGCSLWAALLACAWVASPFVLIRGFSNSSHLAGAMWLPLLILLARRMVREPTAKAAALVATVAAMIVTSGYPPYSLLAGYLMLLGLPFWLWEARRDEVKADWGPVAFACLLAITVAALISAAHVLPLADLIPLSARGTKVSEMSELMSTQAHSGRPFLRAVGVPPPSVFVGVRELWSSMGPGILLPVLAGVALRSWGPTGWYVLLLAALGSIVPFEALRSLPLYGLVRFGLEWTWLGLFALHLSAALGLQAAAERWRLSPIVIALVSGLAAASTLTWSSSAVREMGLWRSNARPPVDLSPLEQAGCDAEGVGARIFWPEATRRGALLRRKIPSIGGYEQSILMDRVARVQQELDLPSGSDRPGWTRTVAEHPSMIARLGLGCAVTSRRAPALERAGFWRASDPRARPIVYRWDGALPRARLVHGAISVESPERALEVVLSERLDPAETLVLESPAQPTAMCAQASDSTAVVTEDEPEQVSVRVTTYCPAYLLLADTWAPGWIATVDGQVTPIVIADYLFRAVHMEPGDHEVVFRYEPRAYRLGRWLSVSGLLLCAVLIILPRGYDPLRTPSAGGRAP